MPAGLTPVEPFAGAGWRGQSLAALGPLDAAEIRRVCDPGAARESLHWGRNYLFRAELRTLAGSLSVVVKQFREQGWRSRLAHRTRGSKAERSFRLACAFVAAGLPTAGPVLWAEEETGGASYYLSEDLAGTAEIRYLLRAARAGREREDFPEIDLAAVLGDLGRLARRMHDAGLRHRDLSVGNVLLRRRPGASGHDLFLVDLNRARHGQRLGAAARMRDLSRLALNVPAHQEVLLRAYWGDGYDLGKLRLFRFFQGAFESKNRLKRPLKAVSKAVAGLRPRRAHAHIPQAPAGASARDRAVWDHLSDQPHQHAGRWTKLGVRLADLPAHAGQLAVLAAAAPRITRRYRELRRELYRAPVPWGGVGLCLRPFPEDPEALLAAVADSGARHLLLRLHPWQSDHGLEEDLARALAARGHDLVFALPQNRELVNDPARWRAQVGELAERFLPYGRTFQVGQAINRSKWGVWRYQEYVDLAIAAREEIQRRDPAAEIAGPAVIDFEHHATAGVLNLRRPGLFFDVVSSLLYVDRRGAPENPQMGFDTVGKVALLKAIADTARNSTGRCWVTEVNWPLWEGPHSPAGKSVSVDPETQADYLVRYYVLALATGLVERVYWWQAVARGYGLLVSRDASREQGRLERRPAFTAFATLNHELAGTVSHGPLPSPEGTRLYRFATAGGGTLVVGWTIGTAALRASLPAEVGRVVDRDGGELARPAGRAVDLGPRPRYFWLS